MYSCRWRNRFRLAASFGEISTACGTDHRWSVAARRPPLVHFVGDFIEIDQLMGIGNLCEILQILLPPAPVKAAPRDVCFAELTSKVQPE